MESDIRGPRDSNEEVQHLRKAAAYVCLVSFFLFALQCLLSTLSSGPLKVHAI